MHRLHRELAHPGTSWHILASTSWHIQGNGLCSSEAGLVENAKRKSLPNDQTMPIDCQTMPKDPRQTHKQKQQRQTEGLAASLRSGLIRESLIGWACNFICFWGAGSWETVLQFEFLCTCRSLSSLRFGSCCSLLRIQRDIDVAMQVGQRFRVYQKAFSEWRTDDWRRLIQLWADHLLWEVQQEIPECCTKPHLQAVSEDGITLGLLPTEVRC